MANLTIAVPDDLLHRARVRAAQEGTSVNQLLRETLERYADDHARQIAAVAWLREHAQAHAKRLPGPRVSAAESRERPSRRDGTR